MLFCAGRALTSPGLDSKNLTDERCPGEGATGRWAFFAGQGEGLYGILDKARSGKEIGPAFDEEAQEGRTFSPTVVDGGRTLCVCNAPGFSCGLGIRFT
ncbi:hypothetical protein ACFXDH_49995 [Streptomyces sp. NPDC059467]|uniref:hypothetical protein n=1 Tax=Streptomyces sp. NPDC059467 TaxID=3346844 RepID=UPI00368A85D0